MKSLLGENEQHKGYAIQILHKMGDVVMKLAAKTTEELRQLHQEAVEQYEDFKSLHLQLNMARGKPCAEQLDLALGVLEALHARSEFANSNGDDCRNYGVWNGLPEMRAIFSKMMDVPADQIILGNNSSLQLSLIHI